MRLPAIHDHVVSALKSITYEVAVPLLREVSTKKSTGTGTVKEFEKDLSK